MRSNLPSLHVERFRLFCLLGALVLVACDDPDPPSGKSSSPAKGSKPDTPKDDSDEESDEASEDESEDDSPPPKLDAGTKPRPGATLTPMGDPNQIKPRDPPVHAPTVAADAGAPPAPVPTPTDSGPPRPAVDAGRPRPADAGR